MYVNDNIYVAQLSTMLLLKMHASNKDIFSINKIINDFYFLSSTSNHEKVKEINLK